MAVDPTDDFETRLNSAQRRLDLDSGVSPPAGFLPSASVWGIGLRVGIELVSACAVGGLIGFGLDRWLRTMPVFLCVFLLAGGAAGIVNVMRLMTPSGSRQRK